MLGNALSGVEELSDYIVARDIITPLRKLLVNERTSARKEAAWVLSNIAGGKQKHIQLLLDSGIILKAIDLVRTDVFEVKKECVWTLANAVNGADLRQTEMMLNLHIIDAFTVMLNMTDATTLSVTMEGVENLLKRGKTHFLTPVFFVSEPTFRKE